MKIIFYPKPEKKKKKKKVRFEDCEKGEKKKSQFMMTQQCFWNDGRNREKSENEGWGGGKK